jgi:nitric oxide reductase large subunit
MENKNKQQKRVSITKFIIFTMWTSIIGLIGVSLPKTIYFINGFSETAFYGHFASYVISVMLFWLLMKNYSFVTEKESNFKRLQKSIKKLSRKRKNKQWQ